VSKDEASLREELKQTSVSLLEKALATSRLPKENNILQATEAAFGALNAAADIESVSQDDVASLPAKLEAATASLTLLRERLRRAAFPRDFAAAVGILEAATVAGGKRLADFRADEALREALDRAPWAGGASFETVKASDVAALEELSDRATEQGRSRVSKVLESSLAAGRAALALRTAVAAGDTSAIAELTEVARETGLGGLEEAEQRLHELVAAAAKAASATAEVDQENTSPFQDGSSNLIFLDLELTSGFYDFGEASRVLEAAIIITDKDLNEIGRGHWVLGGYSRSELASLGPFHQAHFCDAEPGGLFPPPLYSFRGNGLFSDVLASDMTKELAEDAMLELLRRHCPEGACPLVGYSVQCDREVLKTEMPRLYRHLSHQIVDISSFYQLAKLWLSEDTLRWWSRPDWRYTHRAMEDVEDSIEALKWIRTRLFRQSIRGALGGE